MSAYVRLTCADPGFFSGGGGERGSRPENSMDNVFSSPQLILQFTRGGGGSNGFITEKTILFKGSGPVRPPTPPPPLDPHMSNLSDLMYAHKYCLVYFCVAFSRVQIIMTQNESCDIRLASFTLYSDSGGTEVLFSFVMIPIKTIVISYQYCVQVVKEGI